MHAKRSSLRPWQYLSKSLKIHQSISQSNEGTATHRISPPPPSPPPLMLPPTSPREHDRIIPGEEFQYWRWASALSLAVSCSSRDSAEDDDGSSSSSTPLRTVMKEVRTYLGSEEASSSASHSILTQEKNADAVCYLSPAKGLVSAASLG